MFGRAPLFNTEQCNTAQPTAPRIAYTDHMFPENNKTQLFVGWALVVCVAAAALGISSLSNWIVVASVGIVPPLVAQSFWRVPRQTISESIRDARR